MKKVILAVLLGFFLIFSAKSQNQKNLVSSVFFDTNEIQNIEISLESENCFIKSKKTPDILIELYGNNSKKLPLINQNLQNLEIKNNGSGLLKGENCSVFIWVPEDFFAQEYKISSQDGTVSLENIFSEESVLIAGNQKSIKVKNLHCEYFYLENSAENSQINLEKLNCNYFDINANDGKITVNLEKSPEASSKISAKNAPITLFISKNQNFELNVRSQKSDFINNFTKISQNAHSTKIFANGTVPVPIYVENLSGDIVLDF